MQPKLQPQGNRITPAHRQAGARPLPSPSSRGFLTSAPNYAPATSVLRAGLRSITPPQGGITIRQTPTSRRGGAVHRSPRRLDCALSSLPVENTGTLGGLAQPETLILGPEKPSPALPCQHACLPRAQSAPRKGGAGPRPQSAGSAGRRTYLAPAAGTEALQAGLAQLGPAGCHPSWVLLVWEFAMMSLWGRGKPALSLPLAPHPPHHCPLALSPAHTAPVAWH